MKKKIYLLVVVAMLVLCMVGMIACSNNDTSANKKDDTGLDVSDGWGSSSKAMSIDASANTSFLIYSSEPVVAQQLYGFVSVVNKKDGTKAQITIVSYKDSDQYFKVVAPTGGYKADSWYKISLIGSLQFVNYQGYDEISFYIPKAGEVIKNYNENVVVVPADFVKVVSYDEKNDTTELTYNYSAAGKKLSVNDVLIAESETDQVAYKITSRDDIDGQYLCTAVSPNADDVYESLIIEESVALNKNVQDNVVNELDTAAIEEELSELAAASFGIGDARFDINASLNDGDISLSINMTLPDVLEIAEDVRADLILEFVLYSDIEVTTNIAVGSKVQEMLQEAKKGVTLTADFNNTLTFEAKIEDNIQINEVQNLDDIIKQIYDMVQGVDNSDVEIKIFNWIIPIAEGIADVKMDAKATMDFAFHGEIGVKSTSTVTFSTSAVYDPEAEDTFDVTTGNFSYSLDTISVFADADIEVKVGLKADIAFDLLGGVLSIGLRGIVGNYNRVFLDAETSNLLNIGKEDLEVAYGFYFAGGIYYSVGLTYKVASLVSGYKPFVEGEKQLYDAGTKMMVRSITTENIIVGPYEMDLELYGIQEDITTDVVGKDATLIDAKRVTLTDADGYVQLVNGKISLTDEGKTKQLNNKAVTVSVNGVSKTVYVTTVAGVEVNPGEAVVIEIGAGRTNVSLAYVGGNGVKFVYEGASVTIAAEDVVEGTIIIYVDNIPTKVVYVK